MLYLQVALAGGLGALLRFSFGRFALSQNWIAFPYATLLANVLGSFLIGYLAVKFDTKWEFNETTKLTVLAGFLGGFTTFSGFSYETISILQSGETIKAVSYVLLSVVLCLLACALGLAMAKLPVS